MAINPFSVGRNVISWEFFIRSKNYTFLEFLEYKEWKNSSAQVFSAFCVYYRPESDHTQIVFTKNLTPLKLLQFDIYR